MYTHIYTIFPYIYTFFVQIFFIYLPVPPYKELKEQVKEQLEEQVKEQLKENPIHIYVWVGRWDESDSQEMDKAQ